MARIPVKIFARAKITQFHLCLYYKIYEQDFNTNNSYGQNSNYYEVILIKTVFVFIITPKF